MLPMPWDVPFDQKLPDPYGDLRIPGNCQENSVSVDGIEPATKPSASEYFEFSQSPRGGEISYAYNQLGQRSFGYVDLPTLEDFDIYNYALSEELAGNLQVQDTTKPNLEHSFTSNPAHGPLSLDRPWSSLSIPSLQYGERLLNATGPLHNDQLLPLPASSPFVLRSQLADSGPNKTGIMANTSNYLPVSSSLVLKSQPERQRLPSGTAPPKAVASALDRSTSAPAPRPDSYDSSRGPKLPKFCNNDGCNCRKKKHTPGLTVEAGQFSTSDLSGSFFEAGLRSHNNGTSDNARAHSPNISKSQTHRDVTYKGSDSQLAFTTLNESPGRRSSYKRRKRASGTYELEERLYSRPNSPPNLHSLPPSRKRNLDEQYSGTSSSPVVKKPRPTLTAMSQKINRHLASLQSSQLPPLRSPVPQITRALQSSNQDSIEMPGKKAPVNPAEVHALEPKQAMRKGLSPEAANTTAPKDIPASVEESSSGSDSAIIDKSIGLPTPPSSLERQLDQIMQNFESEYIDIKKFNWEFPEEQEYILAPEPSCDIDLPSVED